MSNMSLFNLSHSHLSDVLKVTGQGRCEFIFLWYCFVVIIYENVCIKIILKFVKTPINRIIVPYSRFNFVWPNSTTIIAYNKIINISFSFIFPTIKTTLKINRNIPKPRQKST